MQISWPHPEILCSWSEVGPRNLELSKPHHG